MVKIVLACCTIAMKIDRHGKAKVLSQAEIHRLFNALENVRDKALFAVMMYTAIRVNECVTLRLADVYDKRGRVRTDLIIRKANTKGKLATRTIPVLDDLRRHLEVYTPNESQDRYLFPGRWGRGHLNPDHVGIVLRRACERADIVGVSTHSFRRTALTQMSNAGVPLRVVQQVSGHRNLEQLQRYLEVQPEQVRGAIAALSMLTPVANSAEVSIDGIHIKV